MSSTIAVRSALVSCLLLLSSGAGAGDMYQCVDPAGTTTYTDMPCKEGDDRIRPIGTIKMTVMNKVTSPYDRHVTAKQVFESRATNKKLQQRALATDRATLQAAGNAIMTSERVSALEPRQTFSRNY